MKKSNFALRLLPSLFEEARTVAKAEGVALNQFINVALAEKLAAMRASSIIAERAKRANIPLALEILHQAGAGNPPMEGDELPAGVRIDDRLRVRIEARKSFVLDHPVEAFEDAEDGEPLVATVVAAGQTVLADPDYWKGVQWSGFDVVKFTLGSKWLCARREDFLKSTRPVAAIEAIPA